MIIPNCILHATIALLCMDIICTFIKLYVLIMIMLPYTAYIYFFMRMSFGYVSCWVQHLSLSLTLRFYSRPWGEPATRLSLPEWARGPVILCRILSFYIFLLACSWCLSSLLFLPGVLEPGTYSLLLMCCSYFGFVYWTLSEQCILVYLYLYFYVSFLYYFKIMLFYCLWTIAD